MQPTSADDIENLTLTATSSPVDRKRALYTCRTKHINLVFSESLIICFLLLPAVSRNLLML
jgi:hypothetical protein